MSINETLLNSIKDMKKVYFAPAVEEVELDLKNVILAGSDPSTNNDDNNAEDVEEL